MDRLIKLRLRNPVRYLQLLVRNRGLLRYKRAPTHTSSERPAQVYVISDRLMNEGALRRKIGWSAER